MDWKKNDIFCVKIEDVSDTGEGIGKTDGFTWFVKDAVIGDCVEAKVMKTKKSYGFARLLKVLEPSPSRVDPPCPVARQCGGCQLQAMSYEEQLRFKQNKVLNNLRRIGGFELPEICAEAAQPGANFSGISVFPIIGMETPWRYRNKAQFPFGTDKEGSIITGFYAGRTHSIIENEDCLLGTKENQQILACIRRYMEENHIRPYQEESHTGLLRHVLIRKGFRTGELMVCLVINGSKKDLKNISSLIERLTDLFTEPLKMASISCSINREKTNVIMGREVINLYGPGYITDYIGNVKYRISPLSFYQVNPVQTERLYGTALEYAALTGKETVWDLYCGIGTISLFLAQQAKQVYGVEIIPQAIDDARANAELNGIKNAEFFVGKAEEVLPEQYEKHHVYADVIVVDPPRKGCDIVCLNTIIKMSPERVVYVSCDSATLARDLKYLCEHGYKLEKVQAVDMFPNSVHVESIVKLVRKSNRKSKPDTYVKLSLDMEDYCRIKEEN